MARKRKFQKPTLEQVQEYLDEMREKRFTAENFCNYYDAIGWIIGTKKKMTDWKAAVRFWIATENRKKQ